jgi:hypothetical protein
MLTAYNKPKQAFGWALTASVLAVSGGIAEARRDAPYVGKWAKTSAACNKPSDTLDAPTILKARSYDQFETHCDFTSISNQLYKWRAKVRCSVEGSIQTDTLTMTVSGQTLTYRWGQGGKSPALKSQVLKRC